MSGSRHAIDIPTKLTRQAKLPTNVGLIHDDQQGRQSGHYKHYEHIGDKRDLRACGAPHMVHCWPASLEVNLPKLHLATWNYRCTYLSSSCIWNLSRGSISQPPKFHSPRSPGSLHSPRPATNTRCWVRSPPSSCTSIYSDRSTRRSPLFPGHSSQSTHW